MRSVSIPVLAVWSLVAAPAASQADPQALEVLGHAIEAHESLRAVAFNARFGVEGAGADRAVATEGRVILERLDDDDPLGFALWCDAMYAIPVLETVKHERVLYDGERVLRPDPATGEVLDRGALGAGGERYTGYSGLLWRRFADAPALLAELRQAASVSLQDDDVLVADTPCRAVRFGFDGERSDQLWAFGARDHLLRRISLKNADGGEATLQIEGLRADVPVGARALSLELASVPAVARVAERASSPGAATATLGPAVGDPAPAFALPDPSGETHALDDYAGRLVVLDFWATWCAPCVAAMPELQALRERFADDGVVVLGVSTHETGDPEALMARRGITYPLLLHGERIADDYGVFGLPTLYVIGRDGVVLHRSIAATDVAAVTALVESRIAADR